MKKQDYTSSITANITAKEALEGIIQVSKWWTKNFKGSSQKINDEFIIQYGDAHYSKHKLIEIIPDKKVVWLVTESTLNWIKGDKHEWTNTKMSFEISSKGRQTGINFTHMGLVPGLDCYNNCAKGWDQFIKINLFEFLTEGKELSVLK